MEVHIRPFNAPTIPASPRTTRKGGSGKRIPTGLPPRDLNQWLEQVDPTNRLLSPEPRITRSGRTKKDP